MYGSAPAGKTLPVLEKLLPCADDGMPAAKLNRNSTWRGTLGHGTDKLIPTGPTARIRCGTYTAGDY